MPARINHNAHLRQVSRNMTIHSMDTARQIGQLSSGKRVSRSSDDPASLALADGIASEIRAISEGSRNIQQTFSMLQVAEGSLVEIGAMITRMTQLAMQAGSSVFNDNDRLNTNSEFSNLIKEIDRVAGSTTYNGKNLLTGFIVHVAENSTAIKDNDQTGVTKIRLTDTSPSTFTFVDNPGDGLITLGNGVVTQTVSISMVENGSITELSSDKFVRFRELGIEMTLAGEKNPEVGAYKDGSLHGKTIEVEGLTEMSFQVGPSGTSNDVSTMTIADMRATSAALNLGGLSVVTRQDAMRALDGLRQALDLVVEERNRIGAFQNRLKLGIETSEVVVEKMESAASEIRDADIARSVTEMSKSQIMLQVAANIAVEADADIERILSLLR